MARDPFLIVLAFLTALSGIALLIMVARRRKKQPRRHPSGRGAVDDALSLRGSVVTTSADEEIFGDGLMAGEAKEGQRPIDDYAIPAAFDRSGDVGPDDEPDIGKICPRCGARYGSHHRFCERDNSELAALN